MGFTKLDEGILRSSVMAESSEVFKIFIALLSSCGADGISRVSSVFLASVCHMTEDAVDKAIERLSQPDPRSRSTNDEGRRISRVDGGYRVINYKKYRYYNYEVSPAENKRREAWRTYNETTIGYVYFIRANDRIKIGFSKNPWARLSEIRTSNLDASIIGTIGGSLDDEATLHKRFKRFHLSREWFRADKDLIDEIFDLIREHDGRVVDGTTRYPIPVDTIPATIESISRGRELRRSAVVSASASSSVSFKDKEKNKRTYVFDPLIGRKRRLTVDEQAKIAKKNEDTLAYLEGLEKMKGKANV